MLGFLPVPTATLLPLGLPMVPRTSARLPAARRRRQLLDVALDVFAARGYDGTSMAELAEAAGITKPVLYQHFTSKRELYLELLEDVGRQLQEEVGKATAAAARPHEQVEAGFRAYFRFVAEHRSAFQVLFLGSSRHDREFAVAVEQVEESMADAIAPLIEAGIDGVHRRQLAHALVGMAEVTGRRAVADPDFAPGVGQGRPETLDRLAQRLAELAWAGLRGIRPESG